MPEMPKHAYAIPTMEFGWEHLPTVAEYLEVVIGQEAADLPGELRSFLDFYEACLGLGISRGWKGNFALGHEPRVVVVPAAPGPRLALVWEPGNNHTTFVASEVPMPWLETAPAP